jgi:hypothetical protein
MVPWMDDCDDFHVFWIFAARKGASNSRRRVVGVVRHNCSPPDGEDYGYFVTIEKSAVVVCSSGGLN